MFKEDNNDNDNNHNYDDDDNNVCTQNDTGLLRSLLHFTLGVRREFYDLRQKYLLINM